MLFSADRTEMDGLTCGIATVRPGEPQALHRHAHAEIYFALARRGAGYSRREGSRVGRGSGHLHSGQHRARRPRRAEARLFFAFAADRYQEVRIVYLDDDCGRERKMRPERIYGTRCYSDPRPGRHQAMPAELQIKLPWLVLCPRLGPEACSCADEVRHD